MSRPSDRVCLAILLAAIAGFHVGIALVLIATLSGGST